MRVALVAFVALLAGCGAATPSPYVELDHPASARGLALGGEITGRIDCRDPGIVRNDLPVGTTAALEYELSPPTRCAHVDLVDANGTVVKRWTDVAWCNGRIRGATLTGDGGKTFIRAVADTCAGESTTLTLRLAAAPQ
jgi:hypothetical protein